MIEGKTDREIAKGEKDTWKKEKRQRGKEGEKEGERRRLSVANFTSLASEGQDSCLPR